MTEPTSPAPEPEPPRTSLEILAENTRRLRTARDWSMMELGAKANPDSSNPSSWVSAVETARAAPLSTVDMLAAAFGMTPGQLISEMPCDWCAGSPPEGYSCLSCGTITPQTLRPGQRGGALAGA